MQPQKFLIILALTLVLVMPVFVSAKTQAGTTPDSTFYFFDVFFEKIDLFFTFNTEKKIKKNLAHAEERLAEAEEVAIKKKPEIVAEAMANYEESVATAIENAKGLSEKQKSKDNLALISEETSRHEEVLKEVLTKVPEEAKPAIEKAIKVSTRGHERALQEVEALRRELDELKEEVNELREEIKELRSEKKEEKEKTAKPPEPPVVKKPIATPTPSPITPSSPIYAPTIEKMSVDKITSDSAVITFEYPNMVSAFVEYTPAEIVSGGLATPPSERDFKKPTISTSFRMIDQNSGEITLNNLKSYTRYVVRIVATDNRGIKAVSGMGGFGTLRRYQLSEHEIEYDCNPKSIVKKSDTLITCYFRAKRVGFDISKLRSLSFDFLVGGFATASPDYPPSNWLVSGDKITFILGLPSRDDNYYFKLESIRYTGDFQPDPNQSAEMIFQERLEIQLGFSIGITNGIEIVVQ